MLVAVAIEDRNPRAKKRVGKEEAGMQWQTGDCAHKGALNL